MGWTRPRAIRGFGRYLTMVDSQKVAVRNAVLRELEGEEQLRNKMIGKQFFSSSALAPDMGRVLLHALQSTPRLKEKKDVSRRN